MYIFWRHDEQQRSRTMLPSSCLCGSGNGTVLKAWGKIDKHYIYIYIYIYINNNSCCIETDSTTPLDTRTGRRRVLNFDLYDG